MVAFDLPPCAFRTAPWRSPGREVAGHDAMAVTGGCGANRYQFNLLPLLRQR
jgi:hypothetical protein